MYKINDISELFSQKFDTLGTPFALISCGVFFLKRTLTYIFKNRSRCGLVTVLRSKGGDELVCVSQREESKTNKGKLRQKKCNPKLFLGL